MSESKVEKISQNSSKTADLLLSESTEYGLGEVGFLKDDFWSGLAYGDFNPDHISIETYLKMLNEDAQVSAGATLYKLALLSKEWSIKFPEDVKAPDNGEEIIEFLKWNFININRTVHFRGGLRNALEDLLEAPFIGFVVAEPVYKRVKYHGETKVAMIKLKVLPQETIKFYSDEYGSLIKVTQCVSKGENELKPLAKFVVWSFGMRAGNWYGRPFLKKAYKHWYIKEFLIKKWNTYLERKATPVFLGKTRASNIKNLNKILSSTNEKTVITVSNEDSVDVVQSKDVGVIFNQAIKYHDTMIFRAMLTPTLLLGQEDVGARALGDTHFQVFMWAINKMKEDITAIMNNAIIGLVRMNYPGVEVMPEFLIPELSTEDRDKFANVVKELVTVGVLSPDEKWIRQRLGFPLNVESPEIDVPIEDDVVEGPEEPAEPKTQATKQDDGVVSALPNSMPDKAKKLAVKISPEKIKMLMDSYENYGVGELKEYIDSYGESIIAQATKMLEGYEPTSPNRYDYLEELKKLKAPKDKIVADMILKNLNDYMIKLSSYYIGKIEEKEGKSRKQEYDFYDSDTVKVLRERAFTSAGVINMALLESAKNMLITGIQSGQSVEDMMGQVQLVFPEYSDNRLRTIIRTNITAATNLGGLEVMRDTAGFVDGVQYQAILDDRTTEFCEEHNGETLPINDPRVDAMTPPNHYQCRSMWVPVTILDTEVNKDTWNDNGPQPQKGFGINPEGGS